MSPNRSQRIRSYRETETQLALRRVSLSLGSTAPQASAGSSSSNNRKPQGVVHVLEAASSNCTVRLFWL